MKIKFLLIFFILNTIIYLGVNYEKNKKIDKYLKKQSKQYDIMYSIIYEHFKDKANIIYDTTIKNSRVVDIYKKLNTATPEQKNILRKQLFYLLKDKYNSLKYTKLKQLHFHLSSNESFLRFHKPENFEDDLTKYRETINYVNKNNKPIDGFEAGKIVSGFRFVFPIKDKDNFHLGSVEVSFQISAFTSEFMNKFKVLSNFHINKSIIDKKAWKENIINNYVQSPFKNYYMEKSSLKSLEKYSNLKFKKHMLDKQTFLLIEKNIKKNKTSTIFSKKLNKVITTIPIFHPLTKQNIAFLNIRYDGDYVENKISNSEFTFLIISIFVLIILILIYIGIISQKNATKLLKDMIIQKTKELEESNNTLELRIKQEVQKNREKDIILFQQSKMASMGEMIGNIAHQWRQPLAIINTIVAILHEKNNRGKITQENLKAKLLEVEHKTLYMSQTIEDFLSFFKPSKKKNEFVLIDTINNSILIIEQLISKNNINIKFNIEDNLKIYGFKDEFIQVVLAIITNSIQAFENQEDKHIFIDANKDKESIILNISDNAGGIPDIILDKIFEPYFTTKHKSQGTGLGLYMSKMICENNMNGILSVSNVKNGVKFTIKFKLNKS